MSNLTTRRKGLMAVAAAGALAATAMAGTPSVQSAAARDAASVRALTPAQVVYLSAPDAAPGPGYSATSRRFTPAGIQGSYNLAPLYARGYSGQGKTIAIIDSFGYPQAGADLKTFSQAYDLPLMCGMPDVACADGMPTFSTLTFGNHQVKAPPPNQSPGQEASNAWSVEVALDIEYAHTVAPMANILLVAAPTAETLGVQGLPNMMNAEQYVVDHHLADVVTQSFGAAEGSFASFQSVQNLRHAFVSGTASGVTFLSSSGDYGSTGSGKQPVGQGGSTLSTPQVGWPASDPLVTAVGGTNLCTDPATGLTVDSTHPPATCEQNSGQRETAWNGSGGGFSQVFARPSWQDSLPANSATIAASSRGVPDISMDASCSTYVIVLDTAPGYGGYYGVCGTSAASPMFAGIVAITDQYAGRDLGLINDDLYTLAGSPQYADAFYDVTSGDNVQAGSGIPGYQAGSGWDAVTGLGTPNAADFVPALAGLAKTTAP
ncbi:MAG TPA: S53 family peptidase [Jatrophihabitantaceae bacterium]|nr:S53 family peptidase [Jatrophihabitantaceae bacterium]